MNNKIFISGKVTGDPSYPWKFESACLEVARPQFFDRYGMEVAKKHGKFGFTPVCPVYLNFLDLPLGCWSWGICMMVCLWHMMGCSYVYFLRDWKDSRGAKKEHRWAKFFRKRIIYQIDPTL